MAKDQIIQIADGFWNIRGSHKIAGLIDLGTQSSLVRLTSGKFVLLDAYPLKGDVRTQVMALTDDGMDIEAVIHLHPFHTVHVEEVARDLPQARQYGTSRHHAMMPDVKWEARRSDALVHHNPYEEDLTFTVPRGVDLVPEDEHVHFSSVIALHKPSHTLHVDDTLVWIDVPLVGGLSFHMTLKNALQKREGAARDFRAWAEEFIDMCTGVRQLCTAHGKALPPVPEGTLPLARLVREALESVEDVLAAHEAIYG